MWAWACAPAPNMTSERGIGFLSKRRVASNEPVSYSMGERNKELCKLPAAVLSAVKCFAFSKALTDPESSSIKMVLAGKPRLSCSVIGTETIFMAVVEKEGIRDGMKRIL